MNEKNTFLCACEQEELHLSGAVQSFGALILTEENGYITHVSVNTDAICTSAIPGQFIDPRLAKLSASLGVQVGSNKIVAWHDQGFNGYILMTKSKNKSIIYEFYPSDIKHNNVICTRFDFLEKPNSDSKLSWLQKRLVDYISEATGFERVIYYQFMHNGDGEVIHESVSSSHIGSYIGLRFPASDIPRIARDLYVLNPWRYIYNAPDITTPVVGITPSAPDLTYASLRSVSPVHVVYMGNMGVNTSISFPVILHGELAALITCHHSTPHYIELPMLEEISSHVQHYSMMQSSYLAQKKINLLDGLGRWKADTRIKLFKMIDDTNQWAELAIWLMDSFSASGIMFCVNDNYWGYGAIPNEEAFAVLDDYFVHSKIQIWSEHALSKSFKSILLSPLAGVLGVTGMADAKCHVRLLLFRNEHIESISWGGNPNKPTNSHDGAIGISPRISFEKWVEKTVGKSKVWSQKNQLQALKLRELLLEVERYVQQSGTI